MLSEHTIELRKAVKPAPCRDFGDGDIRIDEQCLHVADSGHLDIVGDGKARNILKAMRKIAGADVVGFSQHFEAQIFRIMRMDAACNRVDFLLQVRQDGFLFVNIAIPVQKQQHQKFDKLLMNHQIAHRIFFGSKEIDIVDFSEEPPLQLEAKAEDGHLLIENAQQLLILIGQTRHMRGHIKLDDEPPACLAVRILRFMQLCRGNRNHIKGVHLIGDALDKMNHVRIKRNAQFIKGMEMLEFHVAIRTAGIIIKKIEDAVIRFIHADGMLVFIT